MVGHQRPTRNKESGVGDGVLHAADSRSGTPELLTWARRYRAATAVAVAALSMAACGPTVTFDDPAGSDGTEPSDTTATPSPTDTATTAAADSDGTTPGSASQTAGATDDSDVDDNGIDTSADDSGTASSGDTGAELITSPNNVYVELNCQDEAVLPILYVEAFAFDEVLPACVPPADIDIDDVLVFVVRDWDGAAGVFEFGPDQPHSASVGFPSPQETPTGFVELFVAESYVPIAAHIELDGLLAGDLDFSVCPPSAFTTCG